MINSSNIDLAIIVPYYKNDFVKEALYSIQRQTNQNFNLYIGDDASPIHLGEILNELDEDFKERLTYHRFEKNLGSQSLIKQWERCINLSDKESFIWLFSDDDLMPDDAVERFYKHINTHGALVDLFRFNVQIIDSSNNVILKSKPSPDFETAENFIRRRIKGECLSTACEYIFTRSIYKNKNGFVEFPLAWASDDATWCSFSEQKGIVTISGSPMSWRMSGWNISSDSEKSFKLKIKSSILYIRFISEKFHFSDSEKLGWLIGQLNLLGGAKKIKSEFFNQVYQSKLFDNRVIKIYLFRKKLQSGINKIKRKILKLQP